MRLSSADFIKSLLKENFIFQSILLKTNAYQKYTARRQTLHNTFVQHAIKLFRLPEQFISSKFEWNMIT